MSFTIDRPPRSDDELYELVKRMWGITIPRHKVCVHHQAPFDAFSTAFFAREPQVMIHGSRGLAGKSQLISILGLTQAAVWGADVNILGGSLAQSTNVLEHMSRAWATPGAPNYMLTSDNKSEQMLTNGAKLRALTASQRTVRGPHPPRLLLDEIDEMDQDIFDAAKGQPMPKNNWLGVTLPAQTTMASTWQHSDGVMTKEMKRFREEDLPIFQWCVAALSTGVITKRGEIPVERVTVDDQVLTRQGWKQVQHVTQMGEKECIDVTASDGRVVTCTPDHKILTVDRGWVQAELLCAGDRLVVLHAGSTVPTTIRGDVEVAPGIEMPLRTASAGELTLDPPGPAGVLRPGHRDQVRDLAASGVVAGVVEGLVVDGSDLPEVDQTMDQLFLPSVAAGDSAISGAVDASLPDQTSILVADCVLDEPVIIDGELLGLVGARTATGILALAEGLTTVETVHVVSVTPAGIRVTYDIGVYGAHEFTANGVVVHNCFLDTSNPIDGWLDPKFIDQKKREIPRAMWETEYELNEPSIGNRAFDAEAIERMFDVGAPRPLRNNREHQEYKILEYRVDREYVASADWAKEQDWTVITVWDVTELPIRLAYYLRIKRRPYPVMIGMFNRLIKDYKADAIHDATGLGNVVSDLIESTYSVWNFLMTGRQRDDMLSEFVAAVENDKVRASRVDTLFSSMKYASTDDLFSRSKEFHLPDEVCSAALAWKAVSNRYPLAAAVGLPKGDNWMAGAIETNRKSEWSSSAESSQGEVYRKDVEELSFT